MNSVMHSEEHLTIFFPHDEIRIRNASTVVSVSRVFDRNIVSSPSVFFKVFHQVYVKEYANWSWSQDSHRCHSRNQCFEGKLLLISHFFHWTFMIIVLIDMYLSIMLFVDYFNSFYMIMLIISFVLKWMLTLHILFWIIHLVAQKFPF